MKAKKVAITSLSAEDIGADTNQLGLAGSPTQVVRVFAPQFSGEKTIITGSIDEQVKQLAEILC